ncbi:SDR family NAD(P)-dependent oxidoreductase, partial [Pseudomonas aeruginosa]
MSVSSASLAGKVAFVQGGSRGIGAAIVRRLAAEGASVAFTYVSSADKSRALAAASALSACRARMLAPAPSSSVEELPLADFERTLA